MDIFSTGPPLGDGLAGWGTEVNSSPGYGAGVPPAAIAGDIAAPSSAIAPHPHAPVAAAAAAPPPLPQASPRGRAAGQTGELELLPKSQVQKVVTTQLSSNASVSSDAADALQKVRGPSLQMSFSLTRLPCQTLLRLR
jgi:hypothetical protein